MVAGASPPRRPQDQVSKNNASKMSAVADVSENLLELSLECERAAGVKKAYRGVELRRFSDGSLIAIYLETKTMSGSDYCNADGLRFGSTPPAGQSCPRFQRQRMASSALFENCTKLKP